MNMASNSRSNEDHNSIVSIPDDIYTPEFYYECDWNGAGMIVIKQQTKMSEIIIIASFATRQLATSFGHLEGVDSHKNTRYQKVCVY